MGRQNAIGAPNKHGLDYGLRTSLAKEVEGQMSIVTQCTNLTVDLPLMKALDWAETSW